MSALYSSFRVLNDVNKPVNNNKPDASAYS